MIKYKIFAGPSYNGFPENTIAGYLPVNDYTRLMYVFGFLVSSYKFKGLTSDIALYAFGTKIIPYDTERDSIKIGPGV